MDDPENREGDHGVEDMINLSVLDESVILRNIRIRYERELIYTFTGSILVSVNPYKMFNIYGLDMVKKYEGRALGSMPPHLFAIGSASYGKMMKDTENQVLVISGESGAGKTEATKLIMQYLAAVNKSGNNLITEQILEANPLLESFGNAKTIRNDNSSRFGKYIEVFFKNGSIVGARTLEYLLEKSRMVTQAQDERNYHVFYEMLEGMSTEQKSKLGLQNAGKYFYLNQGGNCKISGRDDGENFRALSAALDILSFERSEQDTIFKILSSVLHIGNIYFKKIHDEATHDTVVLGSDAEIKWISHLLQLSEDWLKQALTTKVTETRGDRVLTPYNIDQALDSRDAIAKALYSRLFTWLVERINNIICRAERDSNTSLAVLDIFGFEDFHTNSFEQLCINYANETMQFFFNQHIFRLEQKEYSKEGIDWSTIEFRDNQPVIDLLASKPAGILCILDDECSFPQATDMSFLEKCHFHHDSNKLYEKPRMSDPVFYVQHYAGRIKYNVDHFLEKNKDTLKSDVVELLCESKSRIIAQMFKDMRDRLITKTLSKSTGRYVTLKPRTPTVSAGFTESLLSLIDNMSKCNPFFVRCIKPNNHKAPMVFETKVVLDQLRYTGMLETIRIRKMGFPVRIKFPVFISRYHCLLHGQDINSKELPNTVCQKIMNTQGAVYKDLYRIGATKVFMKESLEQVLDTEAKKIQDEAIVRIQKCTRMFLARKKFLLAKTSIHNLQRAIRRYSARKKFLVVRNGIIKAQAQFRMFRQHKKYLKTREELKRKLEQERLLRQKQEEEAKMERERQARQEREIASITNLDIPGELAFVYNKLDDWQSINNDRHIVTVNREVLQMDQHYKLPEDINAFAFSKFTSVFFKDPNWGFTLTPIKSPLTQGITGEEMNQIAVAVFKLILRLMYDRNLRDRQEKAMVDYIIQMGLQHEGLRDEIYSQIANQCWNNQNPGVLERAWNLMAACLSAFPPSKRLCKYLIKFVSDIGLEGHQQLCQHKALQCANIEPQFSRIYPPCLLEWRAIQQKANMALEAKFPDGHKMIGHVESWTNAELFARHLLNIRGLQENSYGWTVQVEEEVDYYEIMGYDYVLDLVSEMEIPPGFPYCRSYYLASSDRTREPPAMRRGLYKNSPHSVDDERYMKLAGSLPQPLEVKHSRIESRSFTPRKNYVEENDDGIEFSMTSVLNQRPTELMMDSLSGSKLNMRYNKRKAPSPPTTNGHGVGNGISNGHITPIVEDMEEVGLDPKSKLNTRYVNGVHTNGVVTPRSVTDEDLSPHSKLNSRYVKSGVIIKERDRIKRHGAGIGMSRKQYQDRYLEGISAASDISAATGQSDWSHWVEDVFNNALNEHVDTLSDAHTLENRLKGGGKGVPGPGVQPAPVPPATLPLLNFGLPANNNVMPTSPPVVPVNDPLQMAAHQMAQQTQQQALYNAYLQQMVSANLQVQAQAQAQMQQQRQQQQNLMQSAQQQMLQQQFLQMQQQQQTPQNLVSPASSFNSVGPFPMVIPREQQQQINGGVGMASAAQPVVINAQGGQINSQPGMPIPISSVTTEVNSTGAPKKVYKMRSQFEGHTEHKTFAPETSTVPTQQALTVNTENSERKESNVRMVPAPAPPPPPQYQDKELMTPRMQSVPPPPPPPPPPPVMQTMEDTFDREKGMFTFTDKQGRARTVRIGKVVWPPPSFEEEKRTREVGRLEIDENVKQNLHERFSPKKQWKKPESPKEELKERKSKSLAESVHLATLQLLEQKLGGNKEKETNENKEIYATKIVQDLGPPPPVPPKPSEPEPKNLKKTEKDEEEQAEPPPLPKTAPPPLPPPTQAMETVTMKKKEPQFLINYNELEKVVTRLYPQGKQKYLSYHNVPWTLNLRKEVFHPRERLENPMALHLVFCQVVQDVYNGGCVRINKEDRIKMRGMLESYGINKDNYLGGSFKNQVKKIVVDTAKEWPTYFAKLFPVAGQGQYGGIRYVGVNHNGINFLTRERSLVEDYLDVLEHHHFEDVIDVVLPTRDTIQINLKNKSVVLFTNRASQLKEMIDLYLQESDKGNKYAMAVKDYITRESTLLSFRRNEIIKLLDPEMALEEGWLYGSLNGMLGYFPAEYVRPLARHEVERSGGMKAQLTEHTIQRMIRPPSRDGYADNRSETSQGTAVQDGKFSMMEFALLHFRESVQKPQIPSIPSSVTGYVMMRKEDGSIRGTIKMIESLKLRSMDHDKLKRGEGNADWTWREQAELVKWTRSPIQASLLKLQQVELNKLALECFLCIMKFMGDYPMGSSQNEVDCALKLLKTCHKYPELRDEVYCQMCKQTTSNRSMKPKSCIMGWRLFAIVACYCDCTEALRPYLFKYLENTASDPTRTYSGAASICLQNLRKTFKYGGRKNVPLQEEVQALANGRISKRFPFIYSGCEKEGMVQIKPCTVVRDAVEEICVRLNINDSVEMEEYTLFLRTKDDMMGTPVFSRLKPEEYVLDVTADLHRNNLSYDLVFQRTVWYYPLRSTDNVVYTELMFFQSLPDYIEGLVVVLKDGLLGHRDEEDIAALGALLHRGYDRVGMPTIKDLPYLIPETVRKMPDYQQQKWLNRIHANMQDVMRRSPLNCKAKFVDILSRWPLFGSTFFSIRNPPTQPVIKGECILAVNKHGIHFLSLDTHETILKYSFSEVLSTRRYRSDNGDNYLDMKLGNLMVQKIVRIETNQGSDISNLIGQYMQVINRHKKRPNDKMSLQRYH
ncbi:unconventional myosin-XV-like isoform X8 [Ostrea edulis]|uniref:unconventional myosin-XV-like isoform X8 n=1 Tax=Ostrea edulis TaxID=37623 RepID=UPI0024AFE695|nr:unconventional myosin-XV-like isoform X8 [Ostrea edulis]